MIQDVDSMGVIGPMALKDLLATNDIKGASIRFAPKGLIVGPESRGERARDGIVSRWRSLLPVDGRSSGGTTAKRLVAVRRGRNRLDASQDCPARAEEGAGRGIAVWMRVAP